MNKVKFFYVNFQSQIKCKLCEWSDDCYAPITTYRLAKTEKQEKRNLNDQDVYVVPWNYENQIRDVFYVLSL